MYWMEPPSREIDFFELGSRLESEFLLMRDVKLRLQYPYLTEVACLVHTALRVGPAEKLEVMGVRNLGEYLILLRQENLEAERCYSKCVNFICSKVRR